ncbi:MAG TPA: dihydropteroate synthase, partial [candidate division Zixibacteria bacterium]|nr:dihydropteroate synthase [candidate division Zixibacteria bacterium]
RFRDLGFPLLVGPSRKRFIAMIHPSSKPADQRLGGSIAAVVAAALGGADIVRVHDIDQTMEALRVAQALRGAVR